MNENRTNRREFIKKTTKAGVAAGAIAQGLTAKNYARAQGANDRIHLALVGCGGRGSWHLRWVARAGQDQNIQTVAACDIWRKRRESAAEIIEECHDLQPKLHTDYREVLGNKDYDAVILATPDHQHCTMLCETMQAGKDAYIEKPIGLEMDELNRAYDAVKKTDRIVQNGTQGRNSPGAITVRGFLRSGKLGKLLRVEECRSFYLPYWNFYEKPESADETNWKMFLFNRPDQPFNADKHGAWMGYRDFSNGTNGGWMSHFSDTVHYVTNCECPKSAVAHGGIFSPTSAPGRTCPDTFTGIVEYHEGFVTMFTTHFGSGANDYTTFFGSKGTLTVDDPSDIRSITVSGEGSEHPEKIAETTQLRTPPSDDNMLNWIRCLRSREQPNTNMEAGYKQGVAVILSDMAMVSGRKMRFDAEKRAVVPA